MDQHLDYFFSPFKEKSFLKKIITWDEKWIYNKN